MQIVLKEIELLNGETYGYRYKKGGEKTLILVHGNMTSSKHWDILMENLSDEFTIYAVDLRGFGISSYNNPINSLEDFSKDLKLFCDSLNLKNFYLMGWSTGGGIVMDFTADNPEYVKKLILMESVGTRGYPIFKKDSNGSPTSELIKTKEEIAKDPIQVIPILKAYEEKNREMLKTIWNMSIYTHNKPSEKKYEEYIDDMLNQRNLVDVDFALAIFNISEESNGIISGNAKAKKIKCPVLILWGKNDIVVPEKMALDIKNDIGENAKLHYLEDCGHSPIIDNINLLKNTVEEFLK
ncbi:alpha/beta hydrolase [Oceanotoga sp. DSM 15011]|uniref:intracellular short-chain-length polyhydroxyalkanoate depolymerase n=1 Tax=Oceanotoga sp. DSM 15011 TaxID=2984951 RepID=UPI0021F4862C|nr:alpha/beta hydrolase [Oceanotoga sp. DSM 15011]UYO99630.1 alpha/beta hydrolase [Oceanotoga sp. DSM 15011]